MDPVIFVRVLAVGLIAVAVVLAVRFELFILRDIREAPGVRVLTKPAWMLLTLVSIPLGGMLWLLYGRPR